MDLLGLEIEANRHRAERYRLKLAAKKTKEKRIIQEPKRHSEGIMNLLSSNLPMSKGVKELKLAVERNRGGVGTEELTDMLNKRRSASQPYRIAKKKLRGRVPEEPEFRATQALRALVTEAQKADNERRKEAQPEKQRACACACLLS